MFLLVIGAALTVAVLWAVSVGAMRELRRARSRDPRAGCQAWVRVRGLRGRLYRCGAPRFADLPRCRLHAQQPTDDPPAGSAPPVRYVDEPAAAGRALSQARIGVPLAVLTALGGVTYTTQWLLQRGG